MQQPIDSNHDELSRHVNGRNSCTGGSLHHFKCELPTFRSPAVDRPLQYLRDLLDYMQFVHVTRQDFKMIIKQSLKGSARDWWEYVESDIDSADAFHTAFTRKYWSREDQQKIRHKLEFGFYNKSDGASRSEYVLRLYNTAKMLSNRPTEEEFVEKFARHFDDTVQQTVLTLNIDTMEAFTQMLDRQDRAGPVNAPRTIPTPSENTSVARVDNRQNYQRPNTTQNRAASPYPQNRNSPYSRDESHMQRRDRSPSVPRTDRPYRSASPAEN
uniref:Retrotransposon gag domain-containing protein n=1 Tax=Trichogramma kaykai TaxID=54128 RepID=A0ABD2WZ11_9HYME